jgi:phospholipid:diacylglycerol acyltransferase
MIPKGGDVIWGGIDWSPEDGFQCLPKRIANNQGFTEKKSLTTHQLNETKTHYGRLISFGKAISERPSDMLKIEPKPFKVCLKVSDEKI